MALLAACAAWTAATAAPQDIRLELQPRVCTLASPDRHCEVAVHAQWQAPREESLCLLILDRPDIRRCWEHATQGAYTVDLVFDSDQVFQLRDADLERVLVSETLRVIREAINYRRKRRQPWSIFE